MTSTPPFEEPVEAKQLAQIFWPTLLSWLLQGFQIDIDHWRQFFLSFGAVWGMEAARLRWLAWQKHMEHRHMPCAASRQSEAELCPTGPMP